MTQNDSQSAGAVAALTSPDGDLHLVVEMTAAGALTYRIFRGEDTPQHHAVFPSALAVRFDVAAFVDGLTAQATGDAATEERSFSLVHGKRRSGRASAVSQTVEISNAEGQQLALDLVVFDDGVAHRFRTVDASSGNWILAADSTSFVFDPDGTAFVQGHDEPGLTKPAAEAVFEALPIGTQVPALPGWSFPALFHANGQWTLLSETGVDGRNVGSHLHTGIRPGEYLLAAAEKAEGEGTPIDPDDGDPVATEGPWALPWKLITTTPTAGGVIESDMVALMAPPTTLTDLDWVKPGRVSWGWWSDSHSPTNPEALRGFIDLAADMGWEYSLIDANWNKMPEGTIESLVAYATERNVGLFLWYNSGGPHNVVTEQPRNRMNTRQARRSEMKWLRDTGIVGIKVDFFHSDKASMNAMALDMLADAADVGLLMNFHGITAPKGWHITWPNLMTTEAVRGSEQYKFDPQFPVAAAKHHTILAFTRNAIAPMDYTPITLSDVDYPHLTTNAHEMALGVLFESPLQHPADKPSAYQELGEAAQRYLRELPVVWDEVVVLDGVPGSHVVLARRHGDGWWIAGINGTHKPMDLALDLTALGAESLTVLTVLVDGADSRDIAVTEWADATVSVTMAARGGFVAFPA